jgi:hypothetical protein
MLYLRGVEGKCRGWMGVPGVLFPVFQIAVLRKLDPGSRPGRTCC